MKKPFDWHLLGMMGLLPLGHNSHWLLYPLGVEWTLVYEIFFYFVCAFFANRFLRRALPVFLLLWLVIIGVASVVYRHHTFTDPNFVEIWFSPFDIVFIGGALGFYVYRVLPPFKWSWMLPCVVLAALLFIVSESGLNGQGIGHLARKFRMNPVYPSLLVYTLAILLILVSWLAAEKNRPRYSRPSVLERFGDYSYALYLIHVPVITSFYLETTSFHGNYNALATLAFFSALRPPRK
jgi:exopolysaccharide production protein ExoZ